MYPSSNAYFKILPSKVTALLAVFGLYYTRLKGKYTTKN